MLAVIHSQFTKLTILWCICVPKGQRPPTDTHYFVPTFTYFPKMSKDRLMICHGGKFLRRYFMFHNEKSTSLAPSNGTATTKSVVSTPRLDKPVTMQEVQDACKMWNLPMILSLKEAAEVIKIQPSTLKRKVSEGSFKGCVSRGKPLRFWSLRLIHQVMSQAG